MGSLNGQFHKIDKMKDKVDSKLNSVLRTTISLRMLLVPTSFIHITAVLPHFLHVSNFAHKPITYFFILEIRGQNSSNINIILYYYKKILFDLKISFMIDASH